MLADALINRAQGERPVTLLGYSLGARVIYSCLMSLAERRAFGIVENVVLMGSPIPSTAADWRVMRTVVTGRMVNVYSENDYILAFLYRTSSIQRGVAGLQPIENIAGVENVDVSEQVSGHLRYRYMVGSILQQIGWESIDTKEVVREQQVLKLMVEQEASEQKEAVEKKHEETGLDEEQITEEAAKGAKVIGNEADWEAMIQEAKMEAMESMRSEIKEAGSGKVDGNEDVSKETDQMGRISLVDTE